MTITLRPDRALFRFSGPDAQKLFNDVVTARIEAQAGPARWWALLSPQGKIQAEGLVGWTDGAFWLDTHASVADSFFKRMRMYRLRADVAMDDLRQSHRVGWAATPVEGAVAHADGRGPTLGFRVAAPLDAAADWLPPGTAQSAARIALGVSELGPDFAADAVFPHDVGMDLLAGVDFKKGCYVGQEVVSRMQHRGTARRRPVIVAGLPDTAVAGTPVLAGDREAGAIGTPIEGRAVATLRLDRLEPGTALTVAGLPVTLELPAWATYQLGEVAAEA